MAETSTTTPSISDSEVKRGELPKLADDGEKNNYGEWEVKAMVKLKEWDLWKYIEGKLSVKVRYAKGFTSQRGVDKRVEYCSRLGVTTEV